MWKYIVLSLLTILVLTLTCILTYCNIKITRQIERRKKEAKKFIEEACKDEDQIGQ
jgi:hypothetical protein